MLAETTQSEVVALGYAQGRRTVADARSPSLANGRPHDMPLLARTCITAAHPGVRAMGGFWWLAAGGGTCLP
ncbi:MAG: hypothetical protein ACM3ML_17360, partial [Micromonosporaceae bacterium]